jgi:hypothetical protein
VLTLDAARREGAEGRRHGGASKRRRGSSERRWSDTAPAALGNQGSHGVRSNPKENWSIVVLTRRRGLAAEKGMAAGKSSISSSLRQLGGVGQVEEHKCVVWTLVEACWRTGGGRTSEGRRAPGGGANGGGRASPRGKKRGAWRWALIAGREPGGARGGLP